MTCLLSRLQKKTFRWSLSWKGKGKKCCTRYGVDVGLTQTRSQCSCQSLSLFSSQFEQLTQMKSTFETRLQRQHELSEVRGASAQVRSVTAARSGFLNLRSLLELQSQRPTGPLKSRSPPGRGRVGGNGRKLPGGAHGHRRVFDKFHGEENGEEPRV